MISKSVKEKDGSNLVASPRTHIMSADVEDYFMVEAFANSVPREMWESWPSRVVKNTMSVLDLFDNTLGKLFIPAVQQARGIARGCRRAAGLGSCASAP